MLNFKVTFTRKKYADVFENREKLFNTVREDFLKVKDNYIEKEDIENFFYPYNEAFFSGIIENPEFEKFEILNKVKLLEIENKKLKKELKRWEEFKSKKPIKAYIKLKNKFRY